METIDIKHYNPDYFYKLSHWAKELGKFSPWERSLAYSVGKYVENNWNLSEKQKTQIRRIIEEATEIGFKYEIDQDDTTESISDQRSTLTKSINQDILHVSIDDLLLDVRSYNALKATGVENLNQLLGYSEEDLLKIRNLGITSVKHIQTIISTFIENIDATKSISDIRNEINHLVIKTRERLFKIVKPLKQLNLVNTIYIPKNFQSYISNNCNMQIRTYEDLLKWLSHIEIDTLQFPIINYIYNYVQKIGSYGCIDKEIDYLLSNLTPREMRILSTRFGIKEKFTLEELGIEFNVSRERIRQIENKAKRKVTTKFNANIILYCQAGILLLENQDDSLTIDSWTEQLINSDILIQADNAYLLLCIAEAGNSPLLPLGIDRLNQLNSALPISLHKFRKKIRLQANSTIRKCGAIHTSALSIEEIKVSDVRKILESTGFAEVFPEWWSKKIGKFVLERVANKMVTYCGPISPQLLRYGMRKHLLRFNSPVPPSQVLVKALNFYDNFVQIDNLIYKKPSYQVKASLTQPERLFYQLVQEFGPLVTYEEIHNRITANGLSNGLVASFLRYSPIVRKVALSIYTVIGIKFGSLDFEEARAKIRVFKSEAQLRPQQNGLLEFELTVGNWLKYGGVIAAGPASSLRGSWYVNNSNFTNNKIKISDNLISGLSPIVEERGLNPGDRIIITFNTWDRTATVVKME